MSTTFQIREAEFDLSVETTGSEKRWIESVGSIRGHEHLDVSSRVESVQLGDNLEHCSLHLIVATVVVGSTPASSNSIDLVEENDASLLRPSHDEELPDHAGPFSDILLDKLAANHTNKAGVSAVRDGTRGECLSSSRGAVEQNTLRRVNTEGDKALGVEKGGLDDFTEFLKRGKYCNVLLVSALH